MGFEKKQKVTRSLSELYTPATNLKAGKGLKLAIWGRAKVGKSHFCLTPPGKIFIIDTESAIKTNIQVFPPELRERVFVADVLQFSGFRDDRNELNYGGMLDVIDEAIDRILETVKEEGSDNITVVIDSASDLWDWLGIWISEEVPGVSHIGKDDKINRLEWGKPNKRYASAMLKLTTSGCNIICTFKAKDAVGPDGADLGYAKPRWQKDSNHRFDLIGEMTKQGTKHILKFNSIGISGGRFGDNIPDLENPTWDSLMKHLEKNCGVRF